ncbi:MAG: hypothetical protein LBG04_03440 [Holosporaceae bacterium]|jgi:hypothetical protein|nr:hypothetical protein [Holosporaceae bacterium]
MKKIIFLGYLSLGFSYLDMADAMNAKQTGPMYPVAKREDIQSLNTLLASSGFITKISKDTLAMKILESSVVYIIQKNLNFIHSSYINGARERLDEIIKSMKNMREVKHSQLRNLSVLLKRVLQCRNDILETLGLEGNDIEHGFADSDNPLMAGILCMFKYIEWNQLRAIAKLLTFIATDPNAGNYRTTYETAAKKINDFLNVITNIEGLIKSLSPTENDLLESVPAVSAEDKDTLLKDLYSLTEQAEHMKQLLEK